MNKKGMTLIEMIAAILVLSIAGIMFLTGFITTLRVMSNSSEYKNASDKMMAYAEDNSINNNVSTSNPNATTYTIKSADNKVDIAVNTSVSDLLLAGYDKAVLRVFKTTQFQLVENTAEYKTLNTATQVLTQTIDEKTTAIKNKNYKVNTGKKMESLFDVYPCNDIYFLNSKITVYDKDGNNEGFLENLNITYPQFPSALLPTKIKTTLPDNQNFYVKFSYAWDFYSRNSKKVVHYDNDILYYLGVGSSSPLLGNKEIINAVYIADGVNTGWYANTSANTYTLDYEFDLTSSPILYRNSVLIDTYSKFVKLVTDENSDWKKLNIKAEFNTNNPDSFWK